MYDKKLASFAESVQGFSVQTAERYDAWFDSAKGRHIFDVEVGCIRDLLEEMPRRWLEIGVGTVRGEKCTHEKALRDTRFTRLPVFTRRAM